MKELGISEKDASSKIQKALNFKAEEILFPPRIIALLVFLGIVLAANKFICGWTCQFGTLQDFIFRLNRDSKDKEGIFKQYKIPFYISNTIRIVFFILFTFIAFVWSFDIVEAINPFTIFKPAALTSISIVFIFLLLVSSLFIYRPWCHLFCPFGLLGWIVEKCSRYKIKVNSTTCTNCKQCVKACPSNAMKSILSKDKIKPDCFSCGTCINTCPTKSITYNK